jgi:hypothetical protein
MDISTVGESNKNVPQFPATNREPRSDVNWELGTGNWKLETGSWKLETGNWELEAGNWKLATGTWQLATGNCPA